MAPAPTFAYQAACPHCEHVLDIYAPLRGETPAPGWVNLCRDCGGLGVFQVDGYTMTLRKANEEEIEQALRIPGLRLLREEANHGGGSF